MSTKRKRDDPAGLISSPFSNSTYTPSSRETSNSPVNTGAVGTQYSWDIPETHLHSRTRKRHRDDRPDPEAVYAKTYDLLFAGSRSTSLPEPTTIPLEEPFFDPVHRPDMPSRQPSLHSYWSLPPTIPPPMASALMTETTIHTLDASCEDCGNTLPRYETDDTSMGGMEDEACDRHACRACRRQVCDMCAVVETGAGRECLQCKTTSKKKWVGGIGWV